MGRIATAPTSGFFSKTARYYDADLFAVDLRRIARWYNQKGFYEAKITGVDELRDDAGRVTLVVHIDEGRRAVVRKIDFNGLEPLSKNELEDINDANPVHTGDGFDEDTYERAKDVLTDQLREHGFAQARVTGRVEVSPEDGIARIVFDAEPGERYKCGKVNVTGNRRISADDIANATGIDRGDPYSPHAIALAQQRVYNLGAFSGVRVGLDPLGDRPVAAVRINVREEPFQTVRFGIGGSAEETRWELPRIRAEYTNRSLLGGLRRLELASTVGYAFVPDPFRFEPSVSGITTQTSAQVTIPNVLSPGLEAIARGEFAREVQSGFSYADVAARGGFLYRRGAPARRAAPPLSRPFNVSNPQLRTLLQRQHPGVQHPRQRERSDRRHPPRLRHRLHADLSGAPLHVRRPGQRDRTVAGRVFFRQLAAVHQALVLFDAIKFNDGTVQLLPHQSGRPWLCPSGKGRGPRASRGVRRDVHRDGRWSEPVHAAVLLRWSERAAGLRALPAGPEAQLES